MDTPETVGHETCSEAPPLAAALAYAKRGWRVLPLHHIADGVCSCARGANCSSPGKHPRYHKTLIPHGAKNATTDERIIRAWWRMWPNANVALATGQASGFFALDTDPRHGGDEHLVALLRERGELPETVQQRTGGGGDHHLFKYPDFPVSNRTGDAALAPGVEIIGDGGLIVVEPSIHISGRPYAWELAHHPDEVESAEAPQWLLDLIREKPHLNGKTQDSDGGPIPKGKRNATLFKLGCAMRARGTSPSAIRAALLAENTARCPPSLDEEEVRKLAESASQYEPGGHASGHDNAAKTAHEPSWPVLAKEALYGLAGDIVNTIDPYTEADPVAVLLNILTAFGNTINCSAHARVQYDCHPARLFVVQVGETSKGRKGTGWSTPRYLFSLADPDWSKDCLKSGLSSGEGLIYNVRDELWKKQPVKVGGRVVDYQMVLVEEAAKDKRLMIVEPEFASTLTVMTREGNTLSAIIRQSWDDGHLSPLTRNNPLKATNAHISIIGHITRQELLARLDDTSKANGFANRFLWVLVRRSKILPEGAAVPDEVLRPLVERLTEVIMFSRTGCVLTRDEDANALWREVYGPLSAGRPGLLGAVLSRAEAQVLRLSVNYALLDRSKVIRVEHLQAALAVWEYCERSAALIFGDRLGDPTADRIRDALCNAGAAGMTENDIYELFGRHGLANERARALNLLASLGLARSQQEETRGRPCTIWRAV